jgi:glycerol-1-phosphate dehydrogenase [NAD(P)+]
MVTQNKCEISIPAILKVEKDILGQVGKYLADMNFHKVVILFGNGLIDLFGDKVLNGMKDNNIEVLLYQEMDTVEINAIMQLGFSFPNTTEAVIGIGGGKVIDAAKYCGFLRNLPFISIPTSASSDGFSSASASLIVYFRQL